MISAGKVKEIISPATFYEWELGLTTTTKQAGWVGGGLCPFHTDRHRGNFRINLDSGAFKCFSCGTKGGDIIAFTQVRHCLKFKEAVNLLCHHWGII